MTIRALVGLFTFNAALIGVGWAILLGLGAIRSWGDAARLTGVAYLVGLGSTMVLLTLELVVGVPVTGLTGSLTLVAPAAAGLLVALRRGRGNRSFGRPPVSVPPISLFVAACLAGIVVYGEALFRAARLASTLGEWDGWWHWVPRAKAIYFFDGLDPELLSYTPPPSYPPGLPAVHALAFHAMGSADDVTLHVQYWFYAAAFVAAIGGLLATRVRQSILVPVLLLVLLLPSFVTRFTWTYADLPLGYLTALAALLVVLWVMEHQSWQLAVAAICLSGAMLTKREGALFALCVFFAAFVATFGQRRSRWPRLALAGLVAVALAIPWRVWFVAHGLPGDGPSGGPAGALDDPSRGWAAVELALTTLVDPVFWLLAPVVAALAILLGVVARAWIPSSYAVAFTLGAVAAASLTIWSETSLPITQDDAVNPIVRMTGTSILVLMALTPLLLERAWSRHPQAPARSWSWAIGPDVLVWRSRVAWSIVLAAALAYPASMFVGYSGQTLPGGLPRFPSNSDCISPPARGQRVRVVVGYAGSFPEARQMRARALAAGLRNTELAQDGCGRLRVSVDAIPSVSAAHALVRAAAREGISATLESDTSE